MNKRVKDILLNMSYFLLGVIGGVTLAIILEYRFKKQMKKKGYVLAYYWRNVNEFK